MKRIKILSLVTVFALVVAPVASMVLSAKTLAASITDVTVALTNDNTSATDNITLTFTAATAITNGTIVEVTYDTAFTGGAALTDGDITVSSGDGDFTSAAESNFAAGYFRSTFTTAGDVTGLVTILIDGTNELTNPATNGNYSWSVTANIGGTGTTYDYGAGLSYVDDENDVLISAVVPPTIDMELYQAGVDAELVDPNSCALGVLSLNQVNTCLYDIGTGTNNPTGLSVYVTSDGALNNGADDITACSGTNCNGVGAAGVNAGNEEYGFYISELGAGEFTAAGSFGTAHQAVPTSATLFATTSTTGSGTNVGEIAQRFEVTHAASMDTSTVVGSYDQLVTYTAFTN